MLAESSLRESTGCGGGPGAAEDCPQGGRMKGWSSRSRACRTVEVLIGGGEVVFSWNDADIQEMALELGKVEFEKPRPCG